MNTQSEQLTAICRPNGIAHLIPPITLNGHELRNALEFVNPGFDCNPDELSAQVSIQYKQDGKDTDGDPAPAGHYLWMYDYPEEGSLRLDDDKSTPSSPQEPAAPELVRFDFLSHLSRQSAFSEKTFGPGERTVGVVDHICKELHEVLDNPTDLTEWIDVVILALDGAWRIGATPEQIVAALVAKQTKNEGRQWPDWRTAAPGKAIEHIKAAGDPQ